MLRLAASLALALLAAGLPLLVLHQLTSHACYCIGSPPSLVEASRFKVVVVDPDEAPTGLVEELRGEGVAVLAYINAGYAESWRSYWNNTSIRSIVHGPTEYEGEYYVEYWSPAWRSLLRGLAERALEAGYSGVYLDNIDAYESIIETGPSWALGVDPRREMIGLVAEVSEEVRARGGLVYVNIGGALADLGGGWAIRSYIDGYFREEHYTVLLGECSSGWRSPLEALYEGLLMAGARLAGLDVVAVEFVNSRAEAALTAVLNAINGAYTVAQPSCDPLYMGPPILLGLDSDHALGPLVIPGPGEAGLAESTGHPTREVAPVLPPRLPGVMEEYPAMPEEPVEAPVELAAVKVPR